MRHKMQFAPPVSADDVCRFALAAYYRACRDATPPIDYPLREVPHWSDGGSFLGTLLEFFTVQVQAQAHVNGVPDLDLMPERLERWVSHVPFGDQHVSQVDPGLWAEMRAMGHGWPDFCAGSAATTSVVAIDVAASNDAAAPLPDDRFSESAAHAVGDCNSSSAEESSNAQR